MKLLKYSLLLLSLFLVNGVFAQERCEIEKVSTTKIDKTDIEEERVTLTIDTKNCDNEKLKIKLKSVKGGSSYTQIDNRIDVLPGYITPQDNQIQLTLDSEESICGTFKSTWGWQCVAAIEIENFTTEEKLFSGFNDPSFTKELIKSSLDNDDKYLQYLTKGIILGNCDTKCGEGDAFENDNDNWDFIETIKGIHPKIASSNCNIKDGDIIWSNYTTQRPVSEQSPQLTINTKNCIGVRLEIDIREDDGVFDDDIEIKAGNQTTDSFSVLVNKETTTLKFKSTNAECDMSGLTPSCRIYVDISHTNKDFSTEQYINQYTSSFKEDISFLSKGVILGYPEISGERSWWDLLSSQVLSSQVSSVKIINTGYWLLLNTDVLENEVINDSPQNLETTPSYDKDSPCYISEDKGYNDNCYEFLAPLPGLGVPQKDASGNETGRYFIEDLGSFQLGEYINTVFEVALGILMVLAVIMIIIAGVEYMTVESIYGKSDAKKRITGAITGLILALGIFLILKAINPRLLKIDFGENIRLVSIEAQDDSNRPAGINNTKTVSGNRVNTGYPLSPSKISSLNLYCPKSGGSNSIKQIAKSFEGKVAYRYGGRGSELEIGQIFDDNAKDRICDDGKKCNEYCPTNNFCIDCSAFISHVLECSGLTTGDLGGTNTILGEEEYINMNKSNLYTGNINGIPLKPGDLIGKTGHIAIYVGNGDFAESSSSNKGRLEGRGVSIINMAERYKSWEFNTVRRLPY